MAIPDQILGIESNNNPQAANPLSSALGPGQFLNSTWLSMIQKYHPELANLPQDQILGMRTDPQLSHEMTQAYAGENGQFLAQKGLPVTPGTTYLAHFAGPTGASKILGAAPDAPVASILGDKVIASNPFLKDMTAGDLKAWADKKMGQPIAGPPAPTLGAPPQTGTPQQPAPQQTAPQQPTQQAQPAQQPVPQLVGGMASQQLSPEMQALLPILNAPIRPAPRMFNLAQAFQKIPTPQGFRGYS